MKIASAATRCRESSDILGLQHGCHQPPNHLARLAPGSTATACKRHRTRRVGTSIVVNQYNPSLNKLPSRQAGHCLDWSLVYPNLTQSQQQDFLKINTKHFQATDRKSVLNSRLGNFRHGTSIFATRCRSASLWRFCNFGAVIGLQVCRVAEALYLNFTYLISTVASRATQKQYNYTSDE